MDTTSDKVAVIFLIIAAVCIPAIVLILVRALRREDHHGDPRTKE